MSEWIIDRRPTRDDAYDGRVWYCGPTGNVRLEHWSYIGAGLQINWMPIAAPEPYVKPNRARVVQEQRYDDDGFEYAVIFGIGTVARHIPTREAAERIAAIYEEMMPWTE